MSGCHLRRAKFGVTLPRDSFRDVIFFFFWCLVTFPLNLEVNEIEEALWSLATHGVLIPQNSSTDGHFHKDVTQA